MLVARVAAVRRGVRWVVRVAAMRWGWFCSGGGFSDVGEMLGNFEVSRLELSLHHHHHIRRCGCSECLVFLNYSHAHL